MNELQIIQCDFANPDHCQAEMDLMRHYMLDNMGDATPLNEKQNQLLIKGLKNHSKILVLLAQIGNDYVGLTNSFVNFSTFASKSFLNIHDVIVHPAFRGKGIGRKLMEENIRIAKEELGCAKITLEVREDNVNARKLYQSLGFGHTIPKMDFWVKHFF